MGIMALSVFALELLHGFPNRSNHLLNVGPLNGFSLIRLQQGELRPVQENHGGSWVTVHGWSRIFPEYFLILMDYRP